MTAIGKITAASLQVGDVVLLEITPTEGWMPAVRKGETTNPVRVLYLGRTTERGRSRVTLDYVFLQLGGSSRHLVVSPSQTFWLASASRKWRDAMEAKGVEVTR